MCLHDRPVADAVRVLHALSLDSAEINSGRLPFPRRTCRSRSCASKGAREEYLGVFA